VERRGDRRRYPPSRSTVFLEGAVPATFRIRVDDEKSGRAAKDALVLNESLAPGWNALKIPLVGMKTADGRELDFSTAVRRPCGSRSARRPTTRRSSATAFV
jgi:hypothetical protein